MPQIDLDNLSFQDKENLREMLAFWTWIRGLNKFAKWVVFIGAPISVGAWTLLKWLKEH